MDEIKLVIFDMDGLLINSERYMWAHNSKILMEELGYKYDLEWHRHLMGAAHDIYEQRVYEEFGNNFPFKSYFATLLKRNDESIAKKEVPLMPGAIELLEYLKKKNIQMTIATSTKKEMTHKMMESTGIDKYFDVITTGDEIINGKPSPDIYLKSLSKFMVPKENVLVLEDGHNGFVSAKNAGLNCIIVEDLAIIQDEDRQNAFKVLHNLNEVIDIIEKNNIK